MTWHKVLLGLSLVTVPMHSQAVEFRGLGDPSGKFVQSDAWGVSGDGRTVVGRAYTADERGVGYRWTEAEGMVELAALPGEDVFASAFAASYDGSVLVGHSEGSQCAFQTAVLWTSPASVQALDPRCFTVYATGVSSDGNVVVGRAFIFSTDGFRWTPQTGVEQLYGRDACGVSGDGEVVVGCAFPGQPLAIDCSCFGSEPSDGVVAYRLESGQSPQSLGFLEGGTRSSAFAASEDGSVVVGVGNSLHGGNEAFYWTQDAGMVGLGDLPGGRFWSTARDVSASGSVVVGGGYSEDGPEAIIWTEWAGMRSVKEVLAAAGVDLSGWRPALAMGVSDDGTVVVGMGWNPNADLQGWMAVIPAPEPYGGPSVAVAALLGLGIRRGASWGR